MSVDPQGMSLSVDPQRVSLSVDPQGMSGPAVVKLARKRMAELLGGALPGASGAFYLIGADMAEALVYLHSKNVVHFDIKVSCSLYQFQPTEA